MKINVLSLSALIALSLQGVATDAGAQAGEQSAGALEEVIVTAQKREQSLQDVPISILVTPGEELVEMGTYDLSTLSYQLPNTHISRGTVADQIYIRGAGSGANASFEQSVGTFVDGVYHGRSRFSQFKMLDVERVEVLRGPQSIYFGNNAIGGAFSITTRKPGDEWEGYALASYEFEDEEYIAEAAVGGPLSDNFRIRLAGRVSGMDGYMENRGTGEGNPNSDDNVIRLTAEWDITDRWTSRLKMESANWDADAPYAGQITDCPPPAPFPGPAGACGVALGMGVETDYDFRRSSDPGEEGDLDASEYALTVTRAGDAHDFMAMLAYTDYDYFISGDTDGIPIPFFNFSAPEDYEQSSLELRWTSTADDSPFDYAFGVYGQEADLHVQANLNFYLLNGIIPAVVPPLESFVPLGAEVWLDQTEANYSAFGSVTWNFSEKWAATVGLRWTTADKEGTQQATNVTVTETYGNNGIPLPAPLQPVAALFTTAVPHSNYAEFDSSELIPSFNVQYYPNDDLNFYFSYSDGFKAGGFDAAELSGNPDRLVFDDESVDAYEVGMKSSFLDRSLALNVALYRSEYEDLQQSVTQFTAFGAFFSVSNVGGLISQGVEMDLTWQLSDYWRLGFNAAYLDTEYEDYANAGCTATQAFLTPAGQPCTQDLTGESPPFAPDYSGSTRAGFAYPVRSNYEFSGDFIVSFSDDYNPVGDKDPVAQQDAWQVYDVRLGFGNPEKGWQIALIGKNLADEKIISLPNDLVASAGSYFRTIQRGRTIALQGRFSW